MLAQRLPSILPQITFEESIEVTKIQSIINYLPENQALILTRPFRNPHHTITPKALIGGGNNPKPRRSKFSTFWCIITR